MRGGGGGGGGGGAAPTRAKPRATETAETRGARSPLPAPPGLGGGEGVAYDSDQRNAALDEDGVTAEVLFPDADASGLGWSEVVGAPFGSGLSSSGDSDPRLVFAGARAHNRWLADFCHESPQRRAGIAL